MDPCLQGSGHLRMCGSQMDQKIGSGLLFHDDLLMFYQAFGVSLSFDRCGMLVAGGPYTSVRYCASIRTYMYTVLERVASVESGH